MYIRICTLYTFQIDMTAFTFLAKQTVETVQIPSLLPNSYTLKILQTRQYYEERLEPNQLVSLPWVQIYCYVVYAIIDVIFCYPCNSSGMRILNTYNIISFQNILVHFPGGKNTNLCQKHKKLLKRATHSFTVILSLFVMCGHLIVLQYCGLKRELTIVVQTTHFNRIFNVKYVLATYCLTIRNIITNIILACSIYHDSKYR